ncbi:MULTISPECIES: ANTAR domain-containing response regulator [unclassified Sedimentibacter]|uniref:ANTAR domain-containing response regulator n=1 Tax=unclassified Sedimentibacter TaxID=2649220 RepID=UPI0027E13724|nr:ANTAR domain-containing protein [Sedimentibacter sp. MB35-C1]WMJ77258.1 ANTAR domain-containing protein [Sedimentibacter sp. MB35-C1]
MDSALIVCGSDKGIQVISKLMNDNAKTQTSSAKSSSEARRLINDSDYDIIVINAPLPDEFGDNLAVTITEISSSGVILIVNNEMVDDISAKVENYGVLIIAKPIIRQVFTQTQKFALASNRRIMGLKSENISLQQKIEEIRIVTRAKCVLIQYLNMTESQAHRYIEKQAMDMRTSRQVIAQNILKTYES